MEHTSLESSLVAPITPSLAPSEQAEVIKNLSSKILQYLEQTGFGINYVMSELTHAVTEQVLLENRYSVSKTAQKLKLSRTGLHERLKKIRTK